MRVKETSAVKAFEKRPWNQCGGVSEGMTHIYPARETRTSAPEADKLSVENVKFLGFICENVFMSFNGLARYFWVQLDVRHAVDSNKRMEKQ
jgi:hypothetical protein